MNVDPLSEIADRIERGEGSSYDRSAAVHALRCQSDLIEALDNITASLETVMTWFGEKMGREDRLSRFKNIADARALIAKARGK